MVLDYVRESMSPPILFKAFPFWEGFFIYICFMLKTIYYVLIFCFSFSNFFAQSVEETFSVSPISFYGLSDTTSYLFLSKPDSSLTSLNYLSSGKKFQRFFIKHYNLNKHIPFQFSYKRDFSAGYFRNSSFRNGQFDIKTAHKLRNFSLKFQGKYINAVRNEFGGISNDSLLFFGNYEPFQVPVNLLDASNNIKFRMSDIDFSFIPKDSAKVFFGTTIFWIRKKSFYSDNGANFYSNNFFSENFSHDSLLFDSLVSSFYVGYKLSESINLNISFGNLYTSYLSDSISYSGNAKLIASKLDYKSNKNTLLSIYGTYIINGYFSKAISIDAFYSNKFGYNFIKIKYGFKNTLPTFSKTTLASNHFLYDYKFGALTSHIAHFYYSYKDKVIADYKFHSVNNGVYFDFYSYPKQYLGNAVVQQIELSYSDTVKRFTFGSGLTISHTSDEIIYPVPPIKGIVNLFYNYKLFSGKLLSKFGFQLNYFFPYYAPKYMPALRRFYAQNQVKTGGYPLLDVICAFKLKRFDLELKVNNVLDRYDNKVWYVFPDYPVWQRNFQVGMKWDLFN